MNPICFQGEELRANDIDVYTVGIGGGADINEMKGISSNPDSRYVLKADNFDSAQALANILGPKICNGTTVFSCCKYVQIACTPLTSLKKQFITAHNPIFELSPPSFNNSKHFYSTECIQI